MDKLFIRTLDKEQAENLRKSGYALLSKEDGLFVFANKPMEESFTFESVGVDRKKIELTNDINI